MKTWFERLKPREQLSLLLLALVLLLYFSYYLLWSPLADKRAQMEARNASVAVSLQRVDAMVSEIMQLRSNGDLGNTRRNLTSVVNQSTAAAGLSVSRMQPNSRGEIQVRLEGAPFGALMSWLHDIEYSQSLLLREVSITQAGAGGRVNATVRIAQGA